MTAEDFNGGTAEVFKAFIQEVHYRAIDILSVCLKDTEDALDALERDAISVDDFDNARINVDYLDDIKQSKLLIFKSEISSCDSEIESQISACNSLNIRSYIQKYKKGLIDQITWENCKYLLKEYGLSIGVGMLTKALMKKIAVTLPEFIKQCTTLFMNRGLVPVLAGGGCQSWCGNRDCNSNSGCWNRR